MKGYTIKFESKETKYEHSFLCEPENVPTMIKEFYKRKGIKKATNQTMTSTGWNFWVSYNV